MKDIKDYLPYYIGQYVVHPALKNSRILTGRWMDSMIQKGIQIKPILRRLSDMTEEENTEWKKLRHAVTDGFHAVLSLIDTPDSFHYLLKQGFDLFGLIDEGAAIDAKTTTP